MQVWLVQALRGGKVESAFMSWELASARVDHLHSLPEYRGGYYFTVTDPLEVQGVSGPAEHDGPGLRDITWAARQGKLTLSDTVIIDEAHEMPRNVQLNPSLAAYLRQCYAPSVTASDERYPAPAEREHFALDTGARKLGDDE